MKTKFNNIVTNTHIVLGDKQDEQEKFERKLQLIKVLRKALNILDSVPTEEEKNDLEIWIRLSIGVGTQWEAVTETILNDEETIALRLSEAYDFNFKKRNLKIEQKALSELEQQANKIVNSKRARTQAAISSPRSRPRVNQSLLSNSSNPEIT